MVVSEGAVYRQWCQRSLDLQMIVQSIADLLTKANQSLSKLDALGLARGPGSFTGLRIGCAVIQGFITVHPKPVIALSSLQITAQSAFEHYGSLAMTVVEPADQAGCYIGEYCFNKDSGMVQPVKADCYMLYEMLAEMDGGRKDVEIFARDSSANAPERFIGAIRPVSVETKSLQTLLQHTSPMPLAQPIEPLYLNCPNYRKGAL